MVLGGSALSNCLDPTEIEVVVTTDVPCVAVNETTIAVGPPGDDSRIPIAKTTYCDDAGTIGTLFVTPSGAIDDDVEIRVTMGVNGIAGDTCSAPGFDGCIVARRELRFIPHHPTTLPIVISAECYGEPCDPRSTCTSGTCVDAGGLTCDQTNTCALDAGPHPSCDVAPTLVKATGAAVTPHIVRTTSGYVIGYETALLSDTTRAYHALELTPTGTLQSEIALNASPLVAGAAVGPIGTDGTNIFASYPTSAGNEFHEVDPSGVTIHGLDTVTTPPYTQSLAGVHYDSNVPAFQLAVANQGTPTLLSFDVAKNGIGTQPANGPPALADVAFAWFDGTYYVSAHDTTTCWLFPATFANSFFTFSTTTFKWAPCTTVRVAENSPSDQLFAMRERTSDAGTAYALVVRSSPSGAPRLVANAVADQSIVALAAGGTAFHLIWADGIALHTVLVGANLNFGPMSTLADAWSGGEGIGFDATSDPASSTYAIAFFSSAPTPGIYFARFCK